MLFNSWSFLVFILVTFGLYHSVPSRGPGRVAIQITLLTVASFVFYAWHTPWLVVVLAGAILINAIVTLELLQRDKVPRARWVLVSTAVVGNLLVLAFFKYAPLFAVTFLPPSSRSFWGLDLTRIPLPIGISFFTFQGISLVVDVYRAGPGGIAGLRPPATPRERGRLALRVAFFKAFFPQLVAGPIVKAHEFMHQIAAKTLADVDWSDVTKKLILGFFLKLVVADNLKEATAALSYPEFLGTPGLHLVMLLYGFSFQIFADFCGYSLIAMGLAGLFGYRLPINFNFPYLSRSVTEFWRRWHISLSSWLRHYLYYPLGGNRRGPARTYANLITVMLLGGLWHGASWSFMVWGGAHGLFLALERAFGVKGHPGEDSERSAHVLVVAVQMFITFHLVTLFWLLFQLPKFGQVILFLREILLWRPGFPAQTVFVILFFSLPVVLYHCVPLVRDRGWTRWASRRPRLAGFAVNALYGFLLFLILTNSGNPSAFIYFQF